LAKPLRVFLRHTLLGSKGNLVSLDDPFVQMSRLLAGHAVKGFIDAGASDGRIACRILRRFPSAIAYMFEPNPAYINPLASCAGGDSRMRPFHVAISDHSGQAELFVTQSRGRASLLKPNARNRKMSPRGASIEKAITVPTVTLDEWWSDQGEPPIEIIKLDIQAGEVRALSGATRLLSRSILLVYTEIFLNPMYEGGALFSEIDSVLRQQGFQLFNLFGPRANACDLLINANAIYLHKRVTM